MNATQLLILPHVQSLLLTILQTRRQQSVGFVLSKRDKTVLPRRYTTDCLGYKHIKRIMSICSNAIWKSTILRLEIHPVSFSFSLPKGTASSGWIICWWHSPQTASKYSWFLKGSQKMQWQSGLRQTEKSFKSRKLYVLLSYQLHGPNEVDLPREIISTNSFYMYSLFFIMMLLCWGSIKG